MRLKKTLSILIALCMMLSLMPAAAMAEDPAGDEQSLENRMQPEHQAALDGPENGTQAEAPAARAIFARMSRTA